MEIAILIWLSVLTIVLLASMRQIAVLSLQAKNNLFSGQDPLEDGIEIGEKIPKELYELGFVAADPTQPWFALVMSGTCATCFDVAFNLHNEDVSSPTVALVAGKPELTENIRTQLPGAISVVEDPAATKIVNGNLKLSTVPFVFEFRDEKLVAKAAVQGSDHLKRFISEAESVSNDEFNARLAEQITINGGDMSLASQEG